MITRIVKFSLEQRTLILVATLILAIVGAWSFTKLPIDAVPDITNVQVQINTSVEALAPEEIEKAITFPIENEMRGLQGLTELRSISKFGLSQVTLVFQDGLDIYRVRQLVAERLQSVQNEIPAGLQPSLSPISTGLGEIYYYTINYGPDVIDKPSSRLDQLMQLRTINDLIVRPQLRSVPGIAEVNTVGGYIRQLHIMPHPDKLFSSGVSLEELCLIIEENTSNAGGGIVERGGERILIRSTGRVQTVNEIKQLPVKFRADGTSLTVGDLAEVEIQSSYRAGAATKNGEEAILSATMMLMGENSRTVSTAVHNKIQEIQQKLPKGIVLSEEYNRSELVQSTISTVQKNLIEGGILVIVVLFIFLGNWQAALIVASVIPLSMLLAFIGMVENQLSGNLMSLGAIDFGLIVDGAVVIVEDVLRRLGESQKELKRTLSLEEKIQVILKSAQGVGRPIVFGVIIITIVYLPILSLTGIEGKMFKPMALTVIFALLASLALALTVVPVLCSYFLKQNVESEESKLLSKLKSLYKKVLMFSLRYTKQLCLASFIFFGIAAVIFKFLGAEFVPQLDEGSFAVHMIRPNSIGLSTSIEMQEKTEQLLLKNFPEISRIFSRIGADEVAADPMGVNVSDTYILFHPKDKWPEIDGQRRSKEELANAMQKMVSRYAPGQSLLFSQPIEMRFNEILEGTRADIAVKIYGNDYGELEKIANEAKEILEKIQGAADVEFDAIGKTPFVEVKLDRNNINKYGVHAAEINDLIATAMGGKNVGFIIEGNQRIRLVVRLAEPFRQDIENLSRLPLQSHAGTITLGQVAQIEFTEQVNTIAREDGQRRIAVMVNLRGRDVESFAKEAESKLTAQLKLPAEYFFEFGGQMENLKEARQRLVIVVPMVLLMVFLIIFGIFQNSKQSLIVFTAIPLALTGGVFALALRGLPFSISAAVGFIALSGIAMLNGVVLVSYFNQLVKEGKSMTDSVLEGSVTRLRPILMTALVASLGFIPMAISSGSGGEVQRPLATVVIGGIISSTFLTLILIPGLYHRFQKKEDDVPVIEG